MATAVVEEAGSQTPRQQGIVTKRHSIPCAAIIVNLIMLVGSRMLGLARR